MPPRGNTITNIAAAAVACVYAAASYYITNIAAAAVSCVYVFVFDDGLHLDSSPF